MCLLLTPSLSQVHRGMFTVPNVALQNAMACRVFRLLKEGVISDGPTFPSHSSSFGGSNCTRLSTLQFPGSRTDVTETLAGNSANNISIHSTASLNSNIPTGEYTPC